MWVLWLPIAAVAGALMPRQRLAAWLGLTLSVAAWVVIHWGFVYESVGEDTYGYIAISRFVTAVGGCLVGGIAVSEGARLGHRALPRARPVLAGAATLVGAAAVVGVMATWIVVTTAPGEEAFEIPLSAEWSVIPREEMIQRDSKTYGYAYTAVMGGDEAPARDERLRVPLIGVSFRPSTRGLICRRRSSTGRLWSRMTSICPPAERTR
jgi:hypothetical protein